MASLSPPQMSTSSTPQVLAVQSRPVKPRSADINENVLLSEVRSQVGAADVDKGGQPLETVLEEVSRKKAKSDAAQLLH